jgi:hypothetical protein
MFQEPHMIALRKSINARTEEKLKQRTKEKSTCTL